MMKKTIYLLFVLGLLPLSVGCEKEIEFKGEVSRPRLTLSARAVVGEPFVAYVASSVFFLKSENQGAAFKEGLDTSRGSVRCYVNGDRNGIEMNLNLDESIASFCYTSNYVPAPDDRIRLEAEFPGFDKVWAEVTVPRMPDFELLSVESRMMDIDWDGVFYAVDMTLAVTDDASYDKYYFIQPLASYASSGAWWGNPEDGETTLSSLIFTSNDVIFRSTSNVLGSDSETALGSRYFSDELIKGRRHVFKITVLYVPAPEIVSLFGLKLAAAEENLFWYDYSFEQLQLSFGGLFSEAVTLYSNVHGGYGILSAAAPVWKGVEW